MLLPAQQQVADPDLVQVLAGRHRPRDVGLRDDPGRPTGHDDEGDHVSMLHQVIRRSHVVVEVNDRGGCRSGHRGPACAIGGVDA
jgi:hypothetical protein